MSKVVLTKEQTDAIDSIELEHDHNIDLILRLHEKRKGSYVEDEKPLNDMDTWFLAKVLYKGYIERGFKSGDFVVLDANGLTNKETPLPIGKITPSLWVDWGKGEETPKTDMFILIEMGDLRHATQTEIEEEKERRFWKKIGREAKRYKKADLVTVEGWEGVYEVIEYHGNNVWLVTADFASTENLVGSEALKLVCPVENRLDVKSNE